MKISSILCKVLQIGGIVFFAQLLVSSMISDKLLWKKVSGIMNIVENSDANLVVKQPHPDRQEARNMRRLLQSKKKERKFFSKLKSMDRNLPETDPWRDLFHQPPSDHVIKTTHPQHLQNFPRKGLWEDVFKKQLIKHGVKSNDVSHVNATAKKELWEGLTEDELLYHGFKTTKTPPLQPFSENLRYVSTDDWDNMLSFGNMTFSQIENRFYSLCRMTHLRCPNEKRVGNKEDGGWYVCLADVYQPKRNGIVYSFGINNDFSFDDMMASYFKTTVHSFDPSMHKSSYERSDRVYFHDIGLAGMDELQTNQWKMLTLEGAMKYLHHENVNLEMLKIDIEFGEFEALQQMLPTGILRRVKQLAFELHLVNLYHLGPNIFKTMYWMLLELERQGFRRFRSDINSAGTIRNKRTGVIFPGCCLEMYYVNLKYLAHK